MCKLVHCRKYYTEQVIPNNNLTTIPNGNLRWLSMLTTNQKIRSIAYDFTVYRKYDIIIEQNKVK